MGKHFTRKDRRAAFTDVARQFPELALPQVRPEPTLGERFDAVIKALFRRQVQLRPRPKAVEALERRLLLSADPVSAAMTFVSATDATLRVAEVQYNAGTEDKPDLQKEMRVQLVQGINPTGSNVTVLSEYRIGEIDGQKRVLLNAVGQPNRAVDLLTVSGTAADNRLVIDGSITALNDVVRVSVDLGAGNDTLVGPAQSTGLVWSVDAVNGATATGEVAMLRAAGSLDTPNANDTRISNRVTYAGGRDEFLSFAGVEALDLKATRDILVDRTGQGLSEYRVTWSTAGVVFDRALTAVDVSASWAATGSTGLKITGAEGFEGAAGQKTHLNFAAQGLNAGQTGVDFNADSGELRVYGADDSARNNPLFSIDVRSVSGVTGTGGNDRVRLARGVDFNLGGGEDVVTGTDDLLVWTVNALGTSGQPEAAVSVAYYGLPDGADADDAPANWVSLNAASRLWGVDRIVGGDAADLLVMVGEADLTAKLSGDDDAPVVDLSYGSGPVLNATRIERLGAEGTGEKRLDLTAWSDAVSVNFALGTATGLEGITGFNAVVTGSGNDEVIAAADTRYIGTGGGDDVITLTRFAFAAVIDAGAGTDRLKGDENALSDEYNDLTVYGEGDAKPDDLDPGTPGLQTRDPLGSYFRITTVSAGGASGEFSTRPAGGTTSEVKASFVGIEAISGQGAADDPDTIEIGFGDDATWSVSDVYKGVIQAGGLKLAYDGIARGVNNGAGQLTLNYGAISGVTTEYAGDVVTDLSVGSASGFRSFMGSVWKLIGTDKADYLGGNDATRWIEGGASDDFMVFTAVVGAVKADGGAGTNNLVGFTGASGSVTLTNGKVALGDGSVDFIMLTGVSGALLTAGSGASAGAVILNAAGYTDGEVTLRGGAGNDSLTGATTKTTFLTSGGSDTLVSGNGASVYVGREVSGNYTLRDRSVGGIEVVKPTGTDALTGTFDQILLRGDASANKFDATGLTVSKVVFAGGAGADTLIGSDGDDTLSGGEGSDSIDGRGGNDLLIESGLVAYDLDDTGLVHEAESDVAYRMTVTLPAATGAEDSFRLKLVVDGIELTTAAIGFDATNAQVVDRIAALRQFDMVHAKVAVTRTDGKISAVTVELGGPYAGRDVGLVLSAVGMATPAGAAAAAFVVAGTTAFTSRERETVTAVERAQLTLDADLGGWVKVSGFSGQVTVTGGAGNDTVILGANHYADLGDGDDYAELTGAGTIATTMKIDGGAGYDRLTVREQFNVQLAETTVALGANSVSHAGFEDFVLVARSAGSELNANGLTGSTLATTTKIATLNKGFGLPVRSGPLETGFTVATRKADGTVEEKPFAGTAFNDLKVIQADGSVGYVDILSTATTMADVIAAFNKVAGLTASIVNGRLQVVSSKTGAGTLRFEGVEVTAANGQGWVDTAMLEALGLSGVEAVGNTVVSTLGSGVSVVLIGGVGSDTLIGSSGDDVILSGGGSDSVTGGAGRDLLLISRARISGDVTLASTSTTSHSINSTLGFVAATGIETVELYGNSGVNVISAETFQGNMIYRTGGGADRIAKGSGVDTIVVEGVGSLAAGAVKVTSGVADSNVANSRDVIQLAVLGTITSDMLAVVDYKADGVAASANMVVGAVPSSEFGAAITRNVSQEDGELNIFAPQTVTVKKLTYKASKITVRANVTQLQGTDGALVFETNDFALVRGAKIESQGNVTFIGRSEDRRFTTGYYNIQAMDIAYRFGVAGSAGLAVVKGKNIFIDLRAGKLPTQPLGVGETITDSGIGRTIETGLVTVLEMVSVGGASARAVSTILLDATVNSRFETTGTGTDGDLKITLATETLIKPKPIGILAAISVGISQITHDVSIKSELALTGDFDLRSAVDATNLVTASPSPIAGIAVSIAANISILNNSVSVEPRSGSSVGGDMRVEATTIRRIASSVNASSGPDGLVAVALGAEISLGSTTARLAADGLTVSGNLTVQAYANKDSVAKAALMVVPSSIFSSMSVTSSSGTVASGNALDDIISNATGSITSGGVAVAKFQFGTYLKATYGSKSATPGPFRSWLGSKLLGSAPTAPKVQFSGAIGVMVDNYTVTAAIGRVKDTAVGAPAAVPESITVGGLVTVDATNIARPKINAVALATNEGDDGAGSSEGGGALAVNVGIITINAYARIEGSVTLSAKDKVTVNANAQNKIDPNGLWGANLITPFVRFANAPTYTYQDGTKTIASGDVVKASDGKLYEAKTARANVNLGTEVFTDPANWKEYTASSLATGTVATMAAYFDDNFWLKDALFDVWAQSFARGETAGVAISASVMITDYEAQAVIGDGATIVVNSTGVAGGTVEDKHDLVVTATATNQTLGIEGNFAPAGPKAGSPNKPEATLGFKKGIKDGFVQFKESLTKGKWAQNPLGEGETAVSIGGAFGVSVDTSKALVKIGQVNITANDLTTGADVDYLGFSIAAAGGKGGKLSLNGAWNHTTLTNEAAVEINAASTVTLSGKLAATATDYALLLRFAGAVSSSNGVSVGLSGVTIFTDRTARVEVKTGKGGSITAGGDVTLGSVVKGGTVGAAIAAAVTAPAPPTNPPSTPTPSTSSSGGGLGSVLPSGVTKSSTKSKAGVAVSGSATGLRERVTIRTQVLDLAALTGNKISLDAADEGVRLLIAGAAAIASSDQTAVGIAGAFVVVDAIKTISALVGLDTSTVRMAVTAGSLAIKARDNSVNINLSAGVAVARGTTGVGVSGSVIVVVSAVTVDAGLNGATLSSMSLETKARNEAYWLQLAGAVAFGSSAGVGVAVAVTAADSLVGVTVRDVGMAPSALLTKLDAQASNALRLDTLAFGVAVAAGSGAKGAGAGMVAINILNASTTVDVTGATLKGDGTGDMILSALQASYMGTGAGGVAGTSGAAAVGVAVAVNVADRGKRKGATDKRGTEVILSGSRIENPAKTLAVLATTDMTMVAVAAGAAVAKNAAIAGSAAVNRSDMRTKLDADATSGVISGGDMRFEGAETSLFTTLAGGFALAFGGSSGAGGAGIAVTLVDTPVTVNFEGDLETGTSGTILGRAEQTLVTIAMGGAGSGGFALGGSLATTVLKGDVAVTAKAAAGKTWQLGSLTISAVDSSTVTSLAGAVGIGLSYGGVGVAIGVIDNSRSITATLLNSGTVNASGRVVVTAGARSPVGTAANSRLIAAIDKLPGDAFQSGSGISRDDLKSQSVNIAVAVGGSKMVGIGFNLAYTKVTRMVSSTVTGAGAFNLSGSDALSGLAVAANDASGIVTVTVGAAAAIGLGSAVAIAVAGSIALAEIDSQVWAEFGASSVNLRNNAGLSVNARNSAQIISVGLGAAAAVGGSTGAGAVGFAAASNKITSVTVARLQNATITATGGDTGTNDVSASAVNTTRIISVSIAAAVAATQGMIGFAGGGAGSGNSIRGATVAAASFLTATGIDGLTVNAESNATIRAVVLGLAVGVAAGGANGGAAALGVAIAINKTEGYAGSLASFGQSGFIVAARLVDSTVTGAGALAVTATSRQLIRADVVAASVAVAATGGFGLGIAGAGAVAVNDGQANVLAEVVGSTGAHAVKARSLTVSALNLSTIYAGVGSAAVAVAVSGGTTIAAAIGLALAHNRMQAATTARISGISGSSQLQIAEGLAVTASTLSGDERLKIDAISVAASVSVAASGATGVALAGAGADARNTITGQTVAELSGVARGTAGSLTVEATNRAGITAAVVALGAGVGVSGGGGAGSAAIGATFVSNRIGTKDEAFKVSARLVNVQMVVDGATRVAATDTATISATTVAVAGAVAVSSDVALAFAGAGADVRNRVYVDVLAEITRGATVGGIGLKTGTLDLVATESASVKAEAVGASISVAVGPMGGSLGVSIGVALALNEVATTAVAKITDAALMVASPMIEAGRITVSASNTATAEARAYAASVAAGVSIFVGVALAGAGANATNRIGNTADVVVTNAFLRTVGGVQNDAASGNLSLAAVSKTTSTAAVVAVVASASAGIIAGAGSIGVSLSASEIGGTDIADRKHVTRVLVTGSTLNASRDLSMTASATEEHHISVAAAAVALAIGVGAAVAGAGIGVSVHNHSTVEALVTDSLLTAGGDVTLRTTSVTTVDDRVPGMVANTMVGVATSVGLGAIAISASVLDVNVANAVRSKVTGGRGSDVQITAGDDVTVSAKQTTELNDLNGVGVTLAGGGIAAAGGGLGITLTADNEVTAAIDLGARARSVAATGGTVSVLADETVKMSSNVANVSIAAAPIGLAIGSAVLASTHRSKVTAQVKRASIVAQDIDVAATSEVDITRVQGTGVSVGAVAITTNKATAEAKATVLASIDDAALVAAQVASVYAGYDVYLRASTLGVSGGLGAFGGMEAYLYSGRDVENDAQVKVSGNSRIQAATVSLDAAVRTDLFGTTKAGGGGLLTGIGAVTTVSDNSTADVLVEDGTVLSGNGVSITSAAQRVMDGSVDAYSLGAASGSGGKLNLEALGDARVRFERGGAAATDRTVITATSVLITSYNQVYKEAIVSTNGKASETNRNVRMGTAAYAGSGTIAGTESNIGTSGDRSVSVVNLGKTRIVGVGTYTNQSSVTLRAITEHSVADAVRVDAVNGLFGISVATLFQTVRAETNVLLDGALIEANSGTVTLETRAGIRNTGDASVFMANGYSGVIGIDVQAKTFTNTDITVKDSRIEGKTVAITAGQANGRVNSLVQRTASNGSLVALFPSLNVALQTNSSNRSSFVNITGASAIRSAGNIFLTAEDGLMQTSFDGLVLVIAVPPYGYDVTNQGSHSSANKVDIASTARLVAGVNYQTIYQVRYAPALLRAGVDISPELGKVTAQMISTITAGGKYVFAYGGQNYSMGYWDSSDLASDLFNGDIVQLDAANAATATGTVGQYYRFIGGADNRPVAIALQKADYTNGALWQQVFVPTQEESDSAFGSDSNKFIRDILRNTIVVVRPENDEDPIVSVGELSTFLGKQYLTVLGWLKDHSTNAEAVVRYQAQLSQIARQMADLGITPPNPDTDTDDAGVNTLSALFLQIPDIVAAPGSIFIEGERPAADYIAMTTGADPVLKANRDVQISILSDVYMMHRVNDVVIDDSKVARYSEFTNDYTEFYAGNVYVNDVLATGSKSAAATKIDLTLTTTSRSEYAYIGQIDTYLKTVVGMPDGAPNLPPDMYLLGSIVNNLGNVTVTNAKGALRLSGQILAQTVNIFAGTDFFVTTDWYHSGPNPRTFVNFMNSNFAFPIRSFVNGVEGSSGKSPIGTFRTDFVSPGKNASVLTALNQARANGAAQSAVVAYGIVSIVATTVNVDGLIQSGVVEAQITISSNFVPPVRTTSLVTAQKTGIAGITFGSVNGTQVPISGRWDSSLQSIVLDEMTFGGGRIEITGDVISTGDGRLVVASGYASVNIRNESKYALIVNGIDTSRDRQGVIEITDTLNKPSGAAAYRTTFTKTSTGVVRTEAVGEVTRVDGGYAGVKFTPVAVLRDASTLSYQPQSGIFYVWTEGQRSTRERLYTEYWKSFNFIFQFKTGQGTKYDEKITALDAQPLLESEGKQLLSAIQNLGGWTTGTPDGETEMFVRFKNVQNVTTELKNGNLVKSVNQPLTGFSAAFTPTVEYGYWRYTGDTPLTVELSTLFYTAAEATAAKTRATDPDAAAVTGGIKAEYRSQFVAVTNSTFAESNSDLGIYLSSYKGKIETVRTWKEGGGYLRKRTIWRETKTVEGQKKYWDIGIRADKAISVEFQTNPNPTVRIESNGDITIAGDIKTAAGTVVLNSGGAGITGGSITSGKGVSVVGDLQAVKTKGSVSLTLVTVDAGNGATREKGSETAYADAKRLDITADGDIDIRIGSTSNAAGSALIKYLESKTGNVYVRAPQGIYADTGALVIANRVELQATEGRIGTTARALDINSSRDNLVGGGVSAAAKFGVNLRETTGDLLLVKPTVINTAFVRPDQGNSISVGSINGTVKLTTLAGSILDYNFEDDSTLTDQRIADYQASMGFTDGMRSVAGIKLDAQVRDNYGRYVEYWNLVRAAGGNGPANADLNQIAAFNALVVAKAARDGSSESVARTYYTERFAAIHAASFDKPFLNDALYTQYYAVIGTSAAGSTLQSTAGFKDAVNTALARPVGAAIEERYGVLHAELAGLSVGTGSMVRDYVQQFRDSAAGRADLAGLQAFEDYAAAKLLTAEQRASFELAHDLLRGYDVGLLTQYINVVRAGTQAAQTDGRSASALVLAPGRGSLANRGAEIVGLVPLFNFAGQKAAIEADLTYKFGAMHAANAGKDQANTYVESLYLTGAAREAAITAEVSKLGSINGLLTTSVAQRLFPLLRTGLVSGDTRVVAENANIVAPTVVLNADRTLQRGTVGALDQPTDIDFKRDLSTLPEAERVAQENLRRGLQVQDISDVVYQLYLRTGPGQATVMQAERGVVDGLPGWKKLNVTFVTQTAPTIDSILFSAPVTIAVGDVIAIWGAWADTPGAEPRSTYKLFRNVSGAAVTVVVPMTNFAAQPATWSPITTTVSATKTDVAVKVAEGAILADVWDVLRVSARPFADVNLRSVSETEDVTLTLTATGLAGVGHDGRALRVALAEAGGFLRLVTIGNLIDASTGSYAAKAQGYVSLLANGAIGEGKDKPFRVSVSNNATLLLQSGGNAFVRQSGGDLRVERAVVGGSLLLETPGNLIIGKIDVVGSAEFKVAGNISDVNADDADPAVNVTAAAMVLDVTGNVGAAGQRIEVVLTGAIEGSVGGSMYLAQDGILTLAAGRDLRVVGTADLWAKNSILGAEGAVLKAGSLVLKSDAGNIGSKDLSLAVLITGSGGSVLADAVTEIWLTSTGVLPVRGLTAADLVTVVAAAAITNARTDAAANIRTVFARLSGASIGADGKRVKTDVTQLAARTTGTGAAWIEETDDLRIDDAYYTEGSDSFAVKTGGRFDLLVGRDVTVTEGVSVGGDAKIVAGRDLTVSATSVVKAVASATLNAARDVSLAGKITSEGSIGAEAGNDLTVTGTVEAVPQATLAAGKRLFVTGAVAQVSALVTRLTAGDVVSAGAGSKLAGKNSLTIDADGANFAADAAGATITLRGSLSGATITVQTFAGADDVLIAPEGLDGNVSVLLGAGADLFTLTGLGERSATQSFVIDGQGGADEYVLNRGAVAVANVVTFADSGAVSDGADILTVNGRDTADIVLIRKNFIALMNDGADAAKVERINYGADMNGRIVVNGLGGADSFYSDDTATIFTLDGGAGVTSSRSARCSARPGRHPPSRRGTRPRRCRPRRAS